MCVYVACYVKGMVNEICAGKELFSFSSFFLFSLFSFFLISGEEEKKNLL